MGLYLQTLFYFQCHWPFLSGIKDILLHTPFSGRSTKRLVPEPRGHCGPEGVREGQEKAGGQEVLGAVLHSLKLSSRRGLP